MLPGTGGGLLPTGPRFGGSLRFLLAVLVGLLPSPPVSGTPATYPPRYTVQRTVFLHDLTGDPLEPTQIHGQTSGKYRTTDQQRFDGATFHLEADFATFARLQIGQRWYRVSGHHNWFYSTRMKCQVGEQFGSTFGFWVNDSSKTNYTGVSDD